MKKVNNHLFWKKKVKTCDEKMLPGSFLFVMILLHLLCIKNIIIICADIFMSGRKGGA